MELSRAIETGQPAFRHWDIVPRMAAVAELVEIEAAVARARAAWPMLSLDDEGFAAQLEALRAELPAEGWARLQVADLYLAWACAQGHAAALAVFEELLWPEIDAALSRVRLVADQRQDVIQNLRMLLFVGSADRPAKIAQYRGQGDLRTWLRAAALRDAFRVTKKARRSVTLDDMALASAAVLEREPGLAHLRESCRIELKQAFATALAALSRSDRLLLRQYHLDRLTVDELAALQGVHRTTAARRVAKARQDLTDAILEDLRRRLKASTSEVHSLMRLVRSQIDISMDRLLMIP
jgi:RNA polymerase sigma-70 factor, ECF subfamily